MLQMNKNGFSMVAHNCHNEIFVIKKIMKTEMTMN